MKKFLLVIGLIVGVAVTAAAATGRGARLPEGAQAGIAVEQPRASARPVAGGIELTVTPEAEGPERFMVYSITGQMVKALDVAPGESLRLELPEGYYIVKTAGWSKRLVVK